jgi:Putative prokaryotic signal transducing protein
LLFPAITGSNRGGSFMEYIALRSFDNYIEANIVLQMLQHAHINCHLKDENVITIDPLLSPALGGIKLMVHYVQAERAWDLMEEAERDYVRTIPCPVCKTHSLKAVITTKNYRCKLAALASALLNGRTPQLTKYYTCTKCGYDFKTLPEG